MGLLLLMSVSGSLMMICYLLFQLFVGDRAKGKWSYWMLKAALFLYLVPIQAVKAQCMQIYYAYFTDGNGHVNWYNEDVIQIVKGRLPRYSLSYTRKYIYTVIGIIILAILFYIVWLYVKKYHVVLKHPAGRNDCGIEADVRRQMDGLGMKRKIFCRVYRGSKDAFTIGAFRPVIVLDDSCCGGDSFFQSVCIYPVLSTVGGRRVCL